MYISPHPNKSTNVRFISSLRNGDPFFIRDLCPEDRDGLLEGFHRLSEHSRYNRFLGVKSTLSSNELSYLCTPDNHNHFALLGYTDQEGIGVARCVRDKAEPTCAEFALSVIDPYQKQGAGSILFERLATFAQQEDITCFKGYAFAHNRTIYSFLEKYKVRSHHIGEGVMEMQIELSNVVDPDRKTTHKTIASSRLSHQC